MRKGRCRSTILQTCNMTPCSLYCPTSHNSTSNTNRAGPAEDAPAPRPDPTRTPEPEGTSPAPDRNEHDPPTIPEDPKTIPAAPDETAVEHPVRRENHSANRLDSFQEAVLHITVDSGTRALEYDAASPSHKTDPSLYEPPAPMDGSIPERRQAPPTALRASASDEVIPRSLLRDASLQILETQSLPARHPRQSHRRLACSRTRHRPAP